MKFSNDVILACACGESYMGKAHGYLDSMEQNGGDFSHRYFFHAGWNPSEWSRNFDLVRPIHVPAGTYPNTLRDNLQQGYFLDYLPDTVAERNPTIVFTDMDMVLQRPLDLTEKSWLENWPEGVVGLSYNSHPQDDLISEAYRLELRVDTEERLLNQFMFASGKVYNMGVVVARYHTYRKILGEYKCQWPMFMAVRPPDQGRGIQFLICHSIHAIGIRVWEMPLSWHAHGHAGLAGDAPLGTSLEQRGLVDRLTDALVLFRHAV